MPFHHVIKNYVILGGHSQDSGGVEDWTSKRKFHRRLPTRSSLMYFFLTHVTVSGTLSFGFLFLFIYWLITWNHCSSLTSPKHEAFMLGTTKIREDSKAFQLFITTAPILDSNDKLYMFGRVIKGVDVVQVKHRSSCNNFSSTSRYFKFSFSSIELHWFELLEICSTSFDWPHISSKKWTRFFCSTSSWN